jgi:hypothetical protein
MYKTHGLSKSPHYYRWRHIMERCYNPTCEAYKDYGGRGIRVCERWHDIRNFIAELPSGYEEGLEIDRIDNDGHYEPGNVKWSTRQQNSSNRRSARLITLDGRTQSLSRWAAEKCLPRTVILNRLDDLDWPVERALTEPVADRMENMRRAQSLRWHGHIHKQKPKPLVVKRFPFNGRDQTIREISDATGISIELLRKRICERNWPIEKATRDARRVV